ncbi:MAG: aminomethyl-transferring glycine dehydrogenase subunit GcvPA [Vicinamibacterales bacterium]
MSHRYIPNTEEDIRRMLAAIGVESIDDLFAQVPANVRLKRDLAIPPAMSEPDLFAHIERLASLNADPARDAMFVGGGVYRHFAPSFIDQMLLRSEFYTAYTPYQPEISQGTLQGIFEFQTLICQLTGMDIANASMYDGSTAMTEASLMATRLARRDKIVIGRSVHPHYRGVLATYAANLGLEIVEAPYCESGGLDLEQLQAMLQGAAAVVFQSPNFFGVIEDPRPIVEIAGAAGALTVLTVTEPLSLAMLQPPGTFGVDVVACELQSFGIPASYGGPHCGVIAAAEKCLRQMPGRLAGMAKDTEGRTGYVLTLSTREQHIRREKATSNICTNSGLMALAASMFMAAYGKKGLPELARLNFDKAHHLSGELARVSGGRLSRRFRGPVFNEFVVAGLGDAEAVHRRLLEESIVAGIPLGKHYPELADCLLLCVTEVNTAAEIDRLVSGLAAAEPAA